MSDRTQSSVRTGAPGDDLAAAGSASGAATGTERSVSSTQSIPTGTQSIPTGTQSIPTGTQSIPTGTQSIPTGTQRAVQGGVPEQPAAAPVPPRGVPVSAPATDAGRAPGPLDAARAAAARNAAGTPARTGKGQKATTKAGGRGPRRARLQLRHIDTWSAFKISLVLSIALFFIWLVAVGVLYGVLSQLGVFVTLNELLSQLSTASGGEGGGDVITPGIVFGAAAVIGAINIVLLTALGTVTTFIYNLCSDLVGGLEVTLSERD